MGVLLLTFALAASASVEVAEMPLEAIYEFAQIPGEFSPSRDLIVSASGEISLRSNRRVSTWDSGASSFSASWDADALIGEFPADIILKKKWQQIEYEATDAHLRMRTPLSWAANNNILKPADWKTQPNGVRFGKLQFGDGTSIWWSWIGDEVVWREASRADILAVSDDGKTAVGRINFMDESPHDHHSVVWKGERFPVLLSDSARLRQACTAISGDGTVAAMTSTDQATGRTKTFLIDANNPTAPGRLVGGGGARVTCLSKTGDIAGGTFVDGEKAASAFVTVNRTTAVSLAYLMGNQLSESVPVDVLAIRELGDRVILVGTAKDQEGSNLLYRACLSRRVLSGQLSAEREVEGCVDGLASLDLQ